MIHNEKHPMAGKKVKIKETATHIQVPNFGGSEYLIEDWWDRVSGESWLFQKGNLACIAYAIRSGFNDLPNDDEVLYGKIGPFGHLVHISEIDSDV